jgi:hypothetical protein
MLHDLGYKLDNDTHILMNSFPRVKFLFLALTAAEKYAGACDESFSGGVS